MLMPNSAPDLREAATAARENAYAPYSNFKVGAAMRGASGKIYIGANMENVSYPVGTCAEEAALAAMIVAGETEVVEAYVIADAPAPVPPCGACRQRLKEFGKDDVTVWMGTTDGKEEATTIGDLLPGAFDAGYMARS
ncbi:MAG: cytidine deaminase [Pseudomonadota bacterium]